MIVIYLLLILLSVVLSDDTSSSTTSSTSSSSSTTTTTTTSGGGSWIHLEGQDHDRVCKDLNMCTLGGYSRSEVFDLVGDVIRSPDYEKDDVSQAICRRLVDKEKKVIFIIGDSYMRHVFQAMVLLISGNMIEGPLKKDHDCIQKCQGEYQFYKHACTAECLVLRHLLCGGLVQIHLIQHVPPSINYCGPGSILLWSEGNHPAQGDRGHEYNNATYWIQKFNSLDYGICTYLKNAEVHECELYWVSSHQRLNKLNPNEDGKITKTFNYGMKKYFIDFQNCGSNTKYLDTYDFTQELVKDLPNEAEKASPDGIHWGLSVNLIKSIMIVIDLIKD
jgi:hypothetical protein